MSDILDPQVPSSSYRPISAQKKSRSNPLLIVLGLSSLFFVVFMVISTVMFLKSPASSKSGVGSGRLFSSGAVGIVELNGVIMDSKKTIKKLRSFEDRDDIKSVVLRLNSPGGAVAPSQEIYQIVKDYKKPIVVSMSSVAASGAFYVAMGAKKIYANPGTITGSIGVIMEFANLEKLYDWAKVKRFSVKTGKFKDVGAEYREMQPEERALLQGMIDDVLVQFKQAVADGRRMPFKKVTTIADGRVFSGSQAKTLGLVDELGTLHDAVLAAGKMGGLQGRPDVVYPQESSRKWLDLIMDEGKGDESEESSSALSGQAPGRFRLADILSTLLGRSGSLAQAVTGLEPGMYWLWTPSQ